MFPKRETGRCQCFSTLRYTRYVMLAVTLLFGLTFALGVTSSHFQGQGLNVTFIISYFILALVVLVFRCIMDKQVIFNSLLFSHAK